MNRREFLYLSALAFSGCLERVSDEDESKPVMEFKPLVREHLLVVAMDTSGSFTETLFGQDGRAYRFISRTIQRLHMEQLGEDAHVLLAQLSENQTPLLWEGSTRSLQRKFKTAEALRDYVLKASDPGGSRLYAGIANAIDYVYRLPEASSGRSEVMILVVSDMDDNSPTQDEDRKVMIEQLAHLASVQAKIGFYFVERRLLDDVRECVTDAGLDPRFIEAGILEDPEIPTFGASF